jgi:hypothetical protein
MGPMILYIAGTIICILVGVPLTSTWRYASVPLILTEPCYSVLPTEYSVHNLVISVRIVVSACLCIWTIALIEMRWQDGFIM